MTKPYIIISLGLTKQMKFWSHFKVFHNTDISPFTRQTTQENREHHAPKSSNVKSVVSCKTLKNTTINYFSGKKVEMISHFDNHYNGAVLCLVILKLRLLHSHRKKHDIKLPNTLGWYVWENTSSFTAKPTNTLILQWVDRYLEEIFLESTS